MVAQFLKHLAAGNDHNPHTLPATAMLKRHTSPATVMPIQHTVPVTSALIIMAISVTATLTKYTLMPIGDTLAATVMLTAPHLSQGQPQLTDAQ